MKRRIPLGQKEGERREFMGGDSLRSPAEIGRAVVAMLNAGGGEVWVGIEEQNGYSVQAQNMRDPDGGKVFLLDYLVDAIEPSPAPDEVEIDIIRDKDQNAVLCVSVRPEGARGPYALLKDGGRHFLIRMGGRLRPMARSEIFGEEPGTVAGRRSVEAATKTVLAERKKHQRMGRELLWLKIHPAPHLKLDLHEFLLGEVLRDARKTGNRPNGWVFANAHLEPVVENGKIIAGEGSDCVTEVRRDGDIVFKAALRALSWGHGAERTIYPVALLEFPISVLRLAVVLYRERADTPARVVADLALFHVGGWKLSRDFSGRWTYPPGFDFPEGDDIVCQKPLTFEITEVREEPDRCGFRLVRRIFQAFGIGEDEIPPEFDQKSGRLILPE
jgi:hypothetical protein